jgi:hypothetical protein
LPSLEYIKIFEIFQMFTICLCKLEAEVLEVAHVMHKADISCAGWCQSEAVEAP